MGSAKRDMLAFHDRHCVELDDGPYHDRGCPLAVYSEEGRPRFKDELEQEDTEPEWIPDPRR